MTIRDHLRLLGAAPRDGSSTRPGYTYQPLLDPAYADVPCHKPDAVRDDFQAVLQAHDWTDARILDCGAHVGFYSQLPGWYHGLEADPHAAAIANAMGIPVTHTAITPATLAQALAEHTPNVVLLLNLPMWLHKQGVLDDCLQILDCTVFFQTAGAQSGGMFQDERLVDKDTEWAYLRQYFSTVLFIRSTTKHRGVRHLWKCL